MPSKNLSLEPKGFRGAIFVFLFMSVMAIACWVGALVLGTEPKMDLTRTAPRTFSIMAENSFAGFTFYQKSIQGVESVKTDNADRDRRGDSVQEKRRQRQREHLVFEGADGRLTWDKENDYTLVDAFMRGSEPGLALRDPAPAWRRACAWGLAGFGFLVFLGGIGAFFPKKGQVNKLP